MTNFQCGSNEIWMLHPTRLIEASESGLLRYTTTHTIRRHKPYIKYSLVATWFNKAYLECKFGKVHRLVYECWSGETLDSSMLICHKDDIQTNNAIDNLYKGTLSSNAIDKWKNGYWPSQELIAKQTAAKIGVPRSEECKQNISNTKRSINHV